MRFADQTLVTQAINGEACELEFGYALPSGESFTFAVHAVYLPRPRIEISGPQGVQATFDWQAARRQRRRSDVHGDPDQRHRGVLTMLTLDLTNEPRWHDLVPGVRVQLRPLTTALMVATRSDPAVETMPEEASDEERAVAFAKALARRAVLAWDGIGDASGNPIDPGPEAIDALLDVWPIFEAFQLAYVSKGLLLEQEKKRLRALAEWSFGGGRALLRSLRASLPGLPGAAEPSGNSGGLAGLGPRRPPRRSAARAAGRRDRLGHVGGAGAR